MKTDKTHTVEYYFLNKQLGTLFIEDNRKHREIRLMEKVEGRKDLKRCIRNLAMHRSNLVALEDEHGERATNFKLREEFVEAESYVEWDRGITS